MMPELTSRVLSHFAFFSFKDAYFAIPARERREFHATWLAGLRQAAGDQEGASHVEVYQVYPAQTGADVLVWSSLGVGDQPPGEDAPAGYYDRLAAAGFFTRFARATNPYRHLVEAAHVLWGFTKPSQYTKTRSTQEIDPFAAERKPYLIIYPFVKTVEWYLMSREARQGMMNEHIKIGKQYPEITQLLLYSFGLQDQEFIVVYETEDLGHFSDLVYELRDSEARRYTQRDAPLFTAVHHPAEETLALWA
jgi:chlorite dismutase